jgi:hypothetical protein
MMVAIHTHGGIMTDEKVQKRAAELGMVLPDETQEATETEAVLATESVILEQTNTQNLTTEAVATHKTSTEETSTEETSTEKTTTERNSNMQQSSSEEATTEKSTEKSTEKTKKTDDKTSSSEEDEVYKITVKTGDYCRQIAEKLYDKKLIDDQEEFRKFMKDHSYDEQIFAGTFEVKKGLSYEEIAKILTTKP